MAQTSENTPLHVDFLPDVKDVIASCLLGMTHLPGLKENTLASGKVDRDLNMDLTRLKDHFEVKTIVTLNEWHELQAMYIETIRSMGMVSILYEIKDMSIPTNNKTFVALVKLIVKKIGNGEKVVVHCKAGKGRTGLLAACCLVQLGMPPHKAIELVRRTRAGTIQTWTQEKYVKTYEKLMEEHNDV